MTTEQWTNIGTIIGVIVGVIAIISALIGALKWLWKKCQDKRPDKLSKEESDCIKEFEQQDTSVEWSDGMERRTLKIYEGLIKKQYIEEWPASRRPSLIFFGLSDKGKDLYKKLLLSSNPKMTKAIQSAKTIFPEKIASASNTSEAEVRKVIGLMEDEGLLVPSKSDNRGTLFWTHK